MECFVLRVCSVGRVSLSLAWVCVSIGSVSWSLTTTAPTAADEVVDEAITGLTAYARHFDGTKGWRLTYRHRQHTTDPSSKVAERVWTNREYRQGDSLCVLRTFSDESVVGYSWHEGVGVRLAKTMITVSPSYDPAFSQITSYTNYLFVDVTPSNAVWDDAVKDVFDSAGPSEHFILALPRTIELHRKEFGFMSADSLSILRLRRNGHDEIDVDRSHGFVCVRRRYEFKPGVPLLEVENRDLVQIVPGFWLPKVQIVRKYYSPPAEPDRFGKVMVDERNELVSFEFANLALSDFKLPMPRSGHVYDRLRKISYRKFPDDLTAEAALEAAIKQAYQPGIGIDARLLPNSTLQWLWVGNGVLLLIMLVLLRRRALMHRPHRKANGAAS